MILFLLTFFFLYGLLHLYVFVKIAGAFALGTGAAVLLVTFMAFMVGVPVIVHMAEKRGFGLSARIFSLVGYTWMALVFLFFAASVLTDLYRVILYAASLSLGMDLSGLMPSSKLVLAVPTLVAVTIASYGFFEARHIRNETVILESPKIPQEAGRLTIAMICDVHLGLNVGKGRLARILEVVKRAKPDILVSVGDLVDGQVGELVELAGLLQAVNPRHGKYAVTGNHEYYAGLDQALDFTEKAGFVTLRGEARLLPDNLAIAGVDYPSGLHGASPAGVPEGEERILQEIPRQRFTILLKHRPVVNERALGLFDIQLSGHTHNGQIFPFTLLSRLFFPVKPGLVRLSSQGLLFVSKGSGTWGPPIRFLSPPEITVIELVHGPPLFDEISHE